MMNAKESMTEDEALGRVHEIGTAFDNDLNDGDGPDYESVTVENSGGHTFLNYAGTTGDNTWIFRWALIPVHPSTTGADLLPGEE